MYDNQCRDLVNGWDHKDDYVAFVVSVSGINRMADPFVRAQEEEMSLLLQL